MFWPLTYFARQTVRTYDADSMFGFITVEIADAQIGRGETEGNNQGPDIESPAGFRGRMGSGPWCADFVWWVLNAAYVRFGASNPVRRTSGAKRLGKNILKAGGARLRDDGSDALPGDVLILHRGPQGSWKGHAAVIKAQTKQLTLATIEGNVGRYPSKVRHFERDPRARVYMIVRPPEPVR